MKYLLINTKTGQQTLCDKVTKEDGFDYYVSDDPSLFKNGQTFLTEENIIHSNYGYNYGDKVIIATNNPNIDIPQIVNEVEQLAHDYFNSDYAWIKNVTAPYSDRDVVLIKHNYKSGYNKAKQAFGNSDQDMVEFAEFRFNCSIDSSGRYLNKSTKELLQLWKEQQLIKVYYVD